MSAFVTAGAGFLLAVLWFDLMFDIQVRGHGEDLPEEVLASIASYYARVTTAARSMNRLITAVMLATLTGLAVEIAAGEETTWVPWASLTLALIAIGLADARIVPAAVRLGRREDAHEYQSAAARSIYRGHIVCALAMTSVLVIQLGFS
jgi:ER membrane protein SH3